MDEVAFAMGYSPKQELLLLGTASGKIHVISLSEKKELRLLDAHRSPVPIAELAERRVRQPTPMDAHAIRGGPRHPAAQNFIT